MTLVTGATGFIGSHLVEKLVAERRPVRCLVRSARHLRFLNPAGVELAQGDLHSGVGVAAALAGIRTVFHLAGTTKARKTSEYYAGNARATENLVRIAGDVECFVHVSSLSAAGPSIDGIPIDEDRPPQPVSHYGRSKLEGEQIVRASNLTTRAIIVRPPVVYGPRDTDVFEVFRTVAKGWMLRVGKGSRWFSAIYVKDLVEGLCAAAGNAAAGNRTYFLSHSKPLEWFEFASLAAAAMGRPVRLVQVPLAAARVVGIAAECWSRISGTPGIVSRDKISEAACRWWTCSPARAAREMGFEARTTAQQGIAETLDWYREAGWLQY